MNPARNNPAATRDDTHLHVHLPRPTAWPLVLALGLTLLAAGLVTQFAVSVVGLVLCMFAAAGWVRQAFTVEGEAEVVVPVVEPAVKPSKRRIEALAPGMPGNRMRIPEKVHPYSAGIKGGIAGGIAMAGLALLYGVVSGRGVWYPVNLLAAMVMQRYSAAGTSGLAQFDAASLGVATFIHASSSIGVGLLFGVLLPTLPRFPVLWGGVVAPLLWTGAIHAFMDVLNPRLSDLVDWKWFIASQFAYGLIVGIVVVRTEKVHVEQRPPLSELKT